MANLDDLTYELENMGISGCSESADSWRRCSNLMEKTHVPRILVGVDRPCEEKDFRDYRNSLVENLKEIQSIIQREIPNLKPMKTIGLDLLLIVGEQSEKSPWNTGESLTISESLLSDVCQLFGVESVSKILCSDDNMNTVLTMIRPKLLKDSWKTYPAAVTCYKWLLNQVEIPELFKYMPNILATALIIFDDYVPENRLIGLECILIIIQHSKMKEEFVDNGFADLIYDAVKGLTLEREPRYIIPLYSCITHILASLDQRHMNHFEWTRRDDVLATLLDNMELEQNLELRHAYMSSLPQLLTHLGCAKWLERITRILAEYCCHHTELRTLKATLLTAETILSLFHLRIPAHCTTLYSAFLKLHFDLTETPIFDKEIINSLERCIHTLYNLTPSIGSVILRDNRMKNIISNSLQFSCTGDTKYCD